MLGKKEIFCENYGSMCPTLHLVKNIFLTEYKNSFTNHGRHGMCVCVCK